MKTLRPYLIWFAVAVLLTIGAFFGLRWAGEHPVLFSGAGFELAQAVQRGAQGRKRDPSDGGSAERGAA